MASDPEPVDILYSTQLYPTPPNNCSPLTDPVEGAEVVPDGAPGVVVAAAIVVPVVAGTAGLVLEHPAIATAIMMSVIVMILKREIFKQLPPDMMYLPDIANPGKGTTVPGLKMVFYVQLY
jgi:hypothetical protein